MKKQYHARVMTVPVYVFYHMDETRTFTYYKSGIAAMYKNGSRIFARFTPAIKKVHNLLHCWLYFSSFFEIHLKSTKAEEGLPNILFPASDFRLPACGFRLPASRFQPPTSDFWLLSFDFRLRNLKHRFSTCSLFLGQSSQT